MSAATAPASHREKPAGAQPLWVSVEGINGVGKTTVSRALSGRLGKRCLLLHELTDQSRDILTGRVISALSARGDVFLRTGHPVVETLALLALKVRQAERVEMLDPAPQVVIEDRGVDSVAAYQAAILAAQDPTADPVTVAQHVLSTASQWRRPPDVTVLLTGDVETCARRFARRIARALSARDLRVITQADHLYTRLASAEPDRFTVVDTTERTAEEIATDLSALVQKREAGHAA